MIMTMAMVPPINCPTSNHRMRLRTFRAFWLERNLVETQELDFARVEAEETKVVYRVAAHTHTVTTTHEG